ncbi:hypothetical protein [Streptomyces stelliscabiei]|jgi:hypothetical protein|uniref:hypothetical protein n=1 Tax=Streptomyces stelliscabiei TaxID=146820 RepID=UPI0029AAFB7F|nr:hypothetical protein [Streptomyces stelliscabiei]MDX2550087.1 hypothetical protein [Streptomyces stelliscabiei]
MPPNLPASGPVRSAAAVNAEIRALMKAYGGWLYGEPRARYEALRDEWTAAVAAETREAAVKAEVVKAA